MSSSPWKVIGASGFVGSSIISRLRSEGIAADPIEAPRLVTHTLSADALIKEARQLEGIIDSLADAFAGADVIVNASGIAAPNMQELPPLVGANALLPALIIIAAQRTGVRRVIHLSSAAVLGSADVLTATEDTAPFSAYSFSKALGEEVILKLSRFIDESAAAGCAPGSENSEFPAASSSIVPAHHALEVCIIRATSVQGRGRRTTEAFARIASSPIATVAGSGKHRSPVSSNYALAEFVVGVGKFVGELPKIVLQPWEGSTSASVIQDAGRRFPLHLPVPLARTAVKTAYAVSEFLGDRFQGSIRRIEVMWFGQDIDDSWARENGLVPEYRVQEVLRNAHTSLGKKRDLKFRA